MPNKVLLWIEPALARRHNVLARLTEAMIQSGIECRECEDPLVAWIQFRLKESLNFSNHYTVVEEDIDHVISDVSLQSYQLEVNSLGVLGEAESVEGLSHAVATFIQILKQRDDSGLPLCSIVDFPLYPNRGVMLDISRGKVPTLQTLKELVTLLFEYKINVFQLYVEHTFHFRTQPRIGESSGRLTGSQISELDRFCRGYGIDLQPNLQTFSHFHQILRLPEYHHLAENNALWTLAPGKEESYELLGSMLEDFLPAFSSNTCNINMDEAYDIGTGFSHSSCQEIGKGRVYLNHILKVHGQVKALGMDTVQLWGEMITKYPELLDQVPNDVLFIDWHYNPDTEYPSLINFRNSNRPYWVASGVSSWNTIFPRVENAYVNITNLAKQGFANGASGFLNTDWGDYGHYQPLGLSFPGYIFGAEQSWNAGNTTKDEFEDAVRVLFFRSDLEYDVWDLLKRSNVIDDLQTGFKTKTIYAFFDDLLLGKSLEQNEVMEPIPYKTFCRYHEVTAKAWRKSQNLGSTKFELELKLAAWMSYYTARKGLFSCQLRELISSGSLTVEEILNQVTGVKSLYQELEAIRELFSTVWDLRARSEGKEISLFYFSKTAVQFYEVVKWLNTQRVAIVEGKACGGLDSYEGANDYTTLWTQDFSNLWDRSYPWN